MKLDDDMVRQLCLDGAEGVGRAKGIYHAVIKTIDAALKLGKEGPPLDPWVVAEAAARFQQAMKDG
jgi:hypothetical protein